MKKIRFFHRTSRANATAILRRGFRDGDGKYMTDTPLSGVWLSNRILDANDGAHGDRVLVLDVELSGSELDL